MKTVSNPTRGKIKESLFMWYDLHQMSQHKDAKAFYFLNSENIYNALDVVDFYKSAGVTPVVYPDNAEQVIDKLVA